MAWKILNELGMYRVGIGWVLCPFPCDVFAVFHVVAVYFCTYFLPFLSNFTTFFFSFHTLMTHEQQDKTQDTIVLVQRNKHRLHCTQDRLLQDGLTASSYRLNLLCDTWTPTITADTVQVLYSRLSLLIPLPEDESSSEVPLSGTIGGGVRISPT